MSGLNLLMTEVSYGKKTYFILTPKYRNDEKGRKKDTLHMHELNGMNCRHGESSGLLVSVMQFMEILVKPGGVVHPVMPICKIVLINENDGDLEDKPDIAIFLWI
jgi:hypothetical protein